MDTDIILEGEILDLPLKRLSVLRKQTTVFNQLIKRKKSEASIKGIVKKNIVPLRSLNFRNKGHDF